MRRSGLAVAAVALSGARLAGAQAHTDNARCDSIVASTGGVVDSVAAVVFVFVAEIRGDRMTYEQRDLIESRIARTFVPPSPLGLSVFEGPALARALRISSGADTLGIPRGASVSGTYRIEVTESGAVNEVEVLRSSLMRGLDSALVRAIRAAATIGTAFRPVSGDRWRLEIRVSGDSVDGAQRLAQGTFPRMRVRDATPASKERPAFPEEARADSLDHGEVVLRFVVDRDGAPALETVELVRSTDLPFTRAALRALASQKFRPATIRGCPVAQVIEFPFIFDDTERPPPRAP
jgi:TonB family protein